jgi:hypothetical protein
MQRQNNIDIIVLYKKIISIVGIVYIAFVLAIIPALRPIGIDRDSANYASEITRIASLNHINIFLDGKEPLFNIIVLLTKYITPDPVRWTLIIYAFLGVLIKIYSINKYSDNKLISILVYLGLFYILYEFNTIRSSIASAIFLLSLEDIKNRNFKNYLIKTIIATMFHYAGIVMLPFYFINARFIRDNLLKLIFLAIIFDVVHINVLIIELLIKVLPSFISSRLSIYQAMLKEGLFVKVSFQRDIYNILMLFILIVARSIIRKKHINQIDNSDFEIVSNILLFSIFLFYLFRSIPVLASRVSEITNIYIVLFVPIIYKIISKNERYAFIGIIYFTCISLLMAYIRSYYPIFWQ